MGTIVNYFKIGLNATEFDSARELALQTKKQGLNLSDLASNFRLHNFIKTFGASENTIESFIANAISMDIAPEKVIELVNQLVDISKTQSIPLHEVPDYITQKLEEKKKIEDEIKEVDNLLQSKNVNVEAINEYIQLREELYKFRIKHIALISRAVFMKGTRSFTFFILGILFQVYVLVPLLFCILRL